MRLDMNWLNLSSRAQGLFELVSRRRRPLEDYWHTGQEMSVSGNQKPVAVLIGLVTAEQCARSITDGVARRKSTKRSYDYMEAACDQHRFPGRAHW